MLVNVSYKNPDLDKKIDHEVGKPFSFIERFKMGGNGSPKLWVTKCSSEIDELYSLDRYPNTCHIELRPKGIIVRFRSLLETFALVIPFYKLSVYKGSAHEYSVFRDQHFFRVKAEQEPVQLFFRTLMQKKAGYSSS